MFHQAITPELAPVPAADRDYADWYEIGEAWVRANSPARNDYAIRQLVHGWMRIHCPPALLAEHAAAVKAANDAAYGTAGFRVGFYGVERAVS